MEERARASDGRFVIECAGIYVACRSWLFTLVEVTDVDCGVEEDWEPRKPSTIRSDEMES